MSIETLGKIAAALFALVAAVLNFIRFLLERKKTPEANEKKKHSNEG